MNKYYTLLIIVLLLMCGYNLTAQKRGLSKVTLKHDTINLSGNTNHYELIAVNKVYNTSPNTQTFRWVIVSANMNTSWDFAICDVNNCYSNTDSQEFTLNANDSGLFDVNIYPNSTVGQGTVLVYIYPLGEYSGGTYFFVKANITSVSIPTTTKIDFSMYPNPVKDFLDIRFTIKGNHSIEVYNILGRRILKKDVYNTDRMRLSFENLQNGMYVVMYRSENGKVITKSISKE